MVKFERVKTFLILDQKKESEYFLESMGEHSQSIDKKYGFEYISRENIRDMRNRANTKIEEHNSLERAIAEVGSIKDMNNLASSASKRMKHMKVF